MRDINEIIKDFYDKLPKFPDGRIDYHTSNIAPVVTVFVECNGKILLLKRSDKVRAYRGKWNVVAGYLDDLKPIREKVLEELREEINMREEDIKNIYFGEVETIADKEIGKTWVGQPALVRLGKKPEIKLDFEHTDYKWITPNELSNYSFVCGLDKTLSRIRKQFKF